MLEKKSTEKEVNNRKWRLNIKFEYTTRNIPQHNSFTDVAIATITNRGRAIMSRANVPAKYWTPLFRYTVTATTKLDMLLIIEVEESRVMRCLHWAGSVPKSVKHLKTWEEVGTVTTKSNSTSKPRDCDVHCMFVGYGIFFFIFILFQ